jgi:glycerol-3-phosphate acyltransferase PlsY
MNMFTGKELSMILCSYVLGCCTAGYYWVRIRTGQDIRRLGSGNVGARNVGRTLGPSGFALTFLFDFCKGTLAIWTAHFLELGPEATIACMLAVVVGHAWPIQLRFHGGKGIATSLGALFCYNPTIGVILFALFIPILLTLRLFTLSGLIAYALCPLAAFLAGYSHMEVAAISFLSILVLITHHRNIREEITRLLPQKASKDADNQEGSDHER